MVSPLRGPEGVTGTLVLARRGPDARFDDTELELIQLFAGHVSIALQNADEHQAAELRAQTDSLTGLKNQGTFRDHMAHWVSRSTPFSLLILDLDGFKAFNDESGHEAGNVLLTNIADSLRAACRDTDEVFRYGGDEFALILPGTEGPGALEVATRIGRSIRGMGADGDGSRGISCSVGVATFPVDASDQAGMILAADRACYAAKRAGRDRIATAREGMAFAGSADLATAEASVIGRDTTGDGIDANQSGDAAATDGRRAGADRLSLNCAAARTVAVRAVVARAGPAQLAPDRQDSHGWAIGQGRRGSDGPLAPVVGSFRAIQPHHASEARPSTPASARRAGPLPDSPGMHIWRNLATAGPARRRGA